MALSILRFEDEGWREAGKAAPPELWALVDQFFRPPGGCLLVAYDPELEKPVVGMAGFARVNGEVCEARNVVVDWGAQGKGVGRALMDALMKEARGRGYAGMRAEAPENVPALVGFYEHEGFVRSPEGMQRGGFVRLERML